jgi:hypothetical protein
MGNRYTGKPMIRLLECYVLWAIGSLEQKELETLNQMEPKLRQVFNQEGDWREIISRVMSLPANMPEMIRTKWSENLEIAKQHSQTLIPQHFAELFVDSNFDGK